MKTLSHNFIWKILSVFLIFLTTPSLSQTIFSETIGTCCGTANTPIAATAFSNSGAILFSGTAETRTTTPSTGYTGASGSRNVFFTNTIGKDFIISNINTSTYPNLSLSFGHYKNTTAGNNELVVEVSADGTTWTALTYSRATGTGTAIWSLITATGSIPSASNLRIRFRQTSSSTQFRIDDIKLINNANTSGTGKYINLSWNNNLLNHNAVASATYGTNFGSLQMGSDNLTRTFTIRNVGSSSVLLTGVPKVTLAGSADFTVISQPSSPLASLTDATFQIQFTPSSVGIKNASISIANDSGIDPYVFEISGNGIQNFFDSDGDGVFDNIDIDDDNDGIKDEYEENNCRNANGQNVNYKFLNETFGAGIRTTINTTYDATTSYCYEDGTVGVNTIECSNLSDYSMNDGEYTVGPTAQHSSWALAYWYKGGDHTPGDVDGRMAMFNASYTPGIFYTAAITGTIPNTPITYSFWAINLDRTDAPDIATRIRPNVRVEFRDLSDNVLATVLTLDIAPTTDGNLAGDWYNFSADLVLPVSSFKVIFINNNTGGLGNDLALDDILITQTLCDRDSDGIADIFDLDDDNDGIPDIVEVGLGHLSNGTAKIDVSWVDADGNGLHDAAEAIISSYASIPDSDGDGVPDYLDLDSDNDSIFDVDESGAGNSNAVAGFENGDGDINGDGVGDGPESETFRNKDPNGDGIIEGFGDGILDIYDYFIGNTSYLDSYGNQNQGLSGTGWVNYTKDTDGDGIPDYLDITSNGITFDIAGTLYGNLDTNGNGKIGGANYGDNYTADADGDGILDTFDTNDTVFGSPRDLDRKLQLYFDGRNDYGEDASIVLSGLSEATIMTWIKIDANPTGIQRILGQDNFYIQLNSDNSITAHANSSNLTYATPIVLNQWVHLAATYSGSAFKLYINGLEVDTGSGGTLSADASSFTLGRKPNTNTNYYRGYMDEVRVFDKALSADELQKMVYQEIELNGANVRGSVIPRDVTDYINTATLPTALPWSNLKRYFRMDVYKDDVIDDLTTGTIDVTGAKIYNMKIIDPQTAPLPFITDKGDTTIDDAVDIPARGIKGTDATTYDWSIVKIEHKNITYNANQKYLGLFVNNQDSGSNPIEFSIQNDTELNVSWYLKLDGFIDLEGESQLVQGDDSMLDQNSGGFIERDQQGTANSFNYNYWSSSVGPITTEGLATGIASTNASFTVGGVIKDGRTASSPAGILYDSSPFAADAGSLGALTISSYWLYQFYGKDNDYNSWFPRINENYALAPGVGYTMKGSSGKVPITNQQNYVFRGKPYNGYFTVELLKSHISPAGDVNRLIGNPYPSALDANLFILDNLSGKHPSGNNIFNGALYFWDHFGEENSHILKAYVGGYATLNLTTGAPAISNDSRINNNLAEGTKVPGQYIPVGQGFFVSTAVDAVLTGVATVMGGDIVFKNSQRVFKKETPANSVFMKSAKNKNENNQKIDESTNTRPIIRLMYDSPTGYHRQIAIGAVENTTNNFDLGYDAFIADIGSEDMYWTIQDAKFVIQGVPNFDENQEFPLGVKIAKTGLARIKIDTLENINENILVYIKDKLLGKTHNISQKPFEIELGPGTYTNRFFVTFKTQKLVTEDVAVAITEETQPINQGIQVFMNNTIRELQIKNNGDDELLSVALINSLGQTVRTWNSNFNLRLISLPVNSVTGIYVVQIITKNGSVSQKVMVE